MPDERSPVPPELASLPDVLTVEELASFLRRPADAVRALLSSGELPGGFKAGREWRMLKSTLIAHVLGSRSGDGEQETPPE